MASNEIRFDHHHRHGSGALVVVPHIDGIPLTELIDRFETGAGMMEDHFHGQSTNAMGPKTPPLGCECGEWGCWPLMASITVTASLVTWDSFEQPHRTTRDYTTFGPFQFDRHQYDDALQDLSTAISPNDV